MCPSSCSSRAFSESRNETGRLHMIHETDAMEKMQDVDIGGFFVGYSPTNHAGSKFVDLTIIARDGKFMR